MSKYIIDIPWSPFLLRLRKYGETFIDNNAVDKKSVQVNDNHLILVRQLHNDIPEWIHSIFTGKIEILQIFAGKPKSIGLIHKDGLNRRAALNVPVQNCSVGEIEWFSEDFPTLTIDNQYTKVRLTNQEQNGIRLQKTPIESYRTTAPCIVNTDEWHRVNNSKNTEYRYVLSLRFFGNPTMNEIFKYYTK